MIDWTRLSMAPAIRRLGALARQEFGVWVGFLDHQGHAYPIGDGLAPVDKPACEQFKRSSVLSNQRGKCQTCAQSLRRWAHRLGEAGEAGEDGGQHTCHAGFSSMLFSIGGAETSGPAGVYVSGYVRSELAHEALGDIRASLQADQELTDADADVDDAVIDAIPRLDRRDRGFIETIATQLVDECRRLIDADDAAQNSAPSDPGYPRDDPAEPGERFRSMIGASRQMHALFESIEAVADSNATVLVEGENGTGKELIARALHLESSRSDQSFVALNCAAIPGELIASELFGHRRGAFSGAHRDRAGLLEEADNGTLLLDEIGDMDLHLQVKLLRFLQEATYTPVGGNRVRKVDVRVVCATHQDLRKLVRQGGFRKDLFFRINVVNLVAPALRRRPADIQVLARHFLAAAAKRHGRAIKTFSDDCLAALKAHRWPGNVRELENEVERLVIMSGDNPVIERSILSERIGEGGAEPDFPAFEDLEMPEAIEQLERTMILQELRQTGWNKSQTARNLGVSRRNLIRKVSNYELEQFRDD